nr:type II toxin-antitoxin system RelB/DinJ family antitoxin [uncultured Fretibacterium sp.]
MAQTNINIRMDENLKRDFDKMCGELGMNMTTAFNIFAKTVVRQQGIPFPIVLDTPNSETLAAIEDVNRRRNLRGPFNSVQALMEDLNADD